MICGTACNEMLVFILNKKKITSW